MSPTSLKLPQRVGRYEVVGQLATGGMAEILLARTTGPEGFVRAVVIKRILPHLAARADFRHMFLDEARIVSGIHHDQVVQVHELGEEDDELFLVMEYLEGETASGLTRRLLRSDRTIPFALAAFIVGQACLGLHAAHELKSADGELIGLVHRDVSPQNLFITYDGAVKLLDFGIAQAAGRSTETEAGQIKGKFAYMSPEQCRGKSLDRRSDIFTMGTVLYELSTARRLFVRDSDMMTMRAICKDPITPPHSLVADYPHVLERICLQALSRARTERPQTAAELGSKLNDVARALADHDLRDALSELMRDVFADRVEKKDAMLRALRAGTKPPGVQPGEADPNIVIPTVQSSSLDESRTGATAVSFDEPAPKRSSRTVAIGLAVGVAGLAALGAVVTLRGPESVEAVPAAVPVAPIAITIDTDPAGAAVWLDDRRLGQTPFTQDFPPASSSVTFVLRKEGFVPQAEPVAMDVSQRVRVTLRPVTPASASASGSAAPPSPPRPRFRPSPKPKPTSTPEPKPGYRKL